MTDDEFYDFLSVAVDEMHQKHDSLERDYGIGTHARWFFSQLNQKLQFLDESEQLIVEADVVDIGSYSSKSNTWKWAWSNDSILPELQVKSLPLKGLESITGFNMFGQSSAFEIEDENMAWELAAMSVRHLGALGCYRAPSSSNQLYNFLAITSIQWVNAPNNSVRDFPSTLHD